MKQLTVLANKHNSDKGRAEGIGHGFTEIYDEYLVKDRDRVSNVLEIGIWDGGSLRMWADYFPNANITGLDINDKSQYQTDRIRCDVVDQSSIDSLRLFVESNTKNSYDIIVDDGSHHMRDQQITLAYLFPLLKPGGIYILEDLHTSMCISGTPLYGRQIIIDDDKLNTTLFFLEKKPYNSLYLTDKQNTMLQHSIESVTIHRIQHNNGGPWGNESITSIIVKK